MRSIFLTVVAAVCLVFANASFADVSATWLNAGSGAFNDGTNWNGGSPPSGATGEGTIANSGSAYLVNDTASLGYLTIQGDNTTHGSIFVDGGSLSLTSATIGFGGGAGGTLSILDNGSVNITGISQIGRTAGTSGTNGGTGTLLISSGTFITGNTTYIGGNVNANSFAQGFVSQTGGTATIALTNNLQVGAASASNSSSNGGQGTYSLSDGTLNVITNSVGLIAGDGLHAVGTFLMSGGTFNVTAMDFGRDNGTGYGDFSAGVINTGTTGVGGSPRFPSPNPGTGTMIVRGTANVTLVPGTPFFVGAQHLNTSMANVSTSNGTVLIQGGALTVNNTVFVGDGTTSTSGTAKFADGTVLVSGGVFAANTVQLGANTNATGYFGLSNGQANINNLKGPSDPSSSGTFSFTGGTLKLRDSSIDVTNDGGTFSPGGSGGVGTTAFADKNYTQNSGGTMWIDISSGTFDTISNGAGTASIAGTIHVQTTDSLNVGDTYDVLTATLVALDPSTMVTGTDASGHPFTASLTNSDTTLTLTVTDVPEPTALAGGVLCAAWLLRRRNRPRRGRMRPLRA